MRKILFIILIISNVALATENPKGRYFLHSLVEQNLNDNSRKAINHWIDFLYESNDSIKASYWDKAERVELKEDYCLFDKLLMQMPREMFLQYFPPFILSVEKIGNDYFLKTVFSQKEVILNDTSAINQNPVAIIEIIVSNQAGEFYLKNCLNYQALNFKKLKMGNIEYSVHPLLEVNKTSCRKANEFCDSLSGKWYGSKFWGTIKYFVTPSAESLSRLLGFDFAYFGFTSGYTSINAKYIFSGTGDFDYRHELAHLIIGDVKNKLLSEGLATYYGGSGNSDFNQLEKEFYKANSPLNEDKIKTILKYPGSKNYYVYGAILVNEVLNKSSINSLKKMANMNISDEKMISEICNVLNISGGDLIDHLNNKKR